MTLVTAVLVVGPAAGLASRHDGNRGAADDQAITVAAREPSGATTDPRADPVVTASMQHWASEYRVPLDLLQAITWHESGWDNARRGRAGETGIGQLLPATASFVADRLIGIPLDATLPDDNIRLTARYLRYLLDHTGDLDLAIGAYGHGLTETLQNGLSTDARRYVDVVLATRIDF